VTILECVASLVYSPLGVVVSPPRLANTYETHPIADHRSS